MRPRFAKLGDDIVDEQDLIDLGCMLTWFSMALMLVGSFVTLVLKSRAYVLAYCLWRKTGDIAVLREVARFERHLQ